MSDCAAHLYSPDRGTWAGLRWFDRRSHRLFLPQNDALSVLRSKVKLHKRFNKGEAPPSRQASLRPPGPARSRISSVRSTASNGSRQSDRADFGPQMQVRLDVSLGLRLCGSVRCGDTPSKAAPAVPSLPRRLRLPFVS